MSRITSYLYPKDVDNLDFANNLQNTIGTDFPSRVTIDDDDNLYTFNSGGTGANAFYKIASDGTRNTAFSTNLNSTYGSLLGDEDYGYVEIKYLPVADKLLMFGQNFDSGDTTGMTVAMVNLDGTTTAAGFNTNVGVFKETNFSFALISFVIEQSDGKIIIGGNFDEYDGNSRSCAVRLNSDGTEDTSFGTNVDGNLGLFEFPFAAALDSNGKIIIGGDFTEYDGNGVPYLFRLNSDGTEDTTFTTNMGTGPDDIVETVFVDSNNNIYISGTDIADYDGTTIAAIVRLTNTGVIDTSYLTNFGIGLADKAYVSELSDGDILYTGPFDEYITSGPTYTTRNGILRTSAAGVEDSAWYGGLGSALDGASNSVIDSDDNICVANCFGINGYSRNGLVKLFDATQSLSNLTIPAGVTEVSIYPLYLGMTGIANNFAIPVTVTPNTTYTYTYNTTSGDNDPGVSNTYGAVYTWSGGAILKISWVE